MCTLCFEDLGKKDLSRFGVVGSPTSVERIFAPEVMAGPEGTAANAKKLLQYGVSEVFVYEHEGFAGFKAASYPANMGSATDVWNI